MSDHYTSTRLPSNSGDHLSYVDEARAHAAARMFEAEGHRVSLVAGEPDGHYGFDVFDLWSANEAWL